MKHQIFFFFCASLQLVLSCQPATQKVVDANEAYYESIKDLTGAEFDERLQGADSLTFFFYDNPDGDAKRYTRFYKEYVTRDSMLLAVMSKSVQKKFIRLEQIKDCRSQGKVFLFENSKPKQTLYFSNRGDSCNHIYFIKDGWFYYMDMDSTTANLLNSLKPLATKPAGDAGMTE
jgi:hypothetical protein